MKVKNEIIDIDGVVHSHSYDVIPAPILFDTYLKCRSCGKSFLQSESLHKTAKHFDECAGEIVQKIEFPPSESFVLRDEYEREYFMWFKKMIDKHRRGRIEHGFGDININPTKEISEEVLDILNYHLIGEANKRKHV